MAELGARVVNRRKDGDDAIVSVDVNLWRPLNIVGVETDEEFDQLLKSRARARALVHEKVVPSMQAVVEDLANGDIRRMTEIESISDIDPRFDGIAKKKRVRVRVKE